MDSVYCKPGVYVGGCGADHMCGWCESDQEPPTIRTHLLRQDADGRWEELFKPMWFYHMASLDNVASAVEDLSRVTGKQYALAVNWSD